MAIFSGKIEQAYYISEDYSNIEVIFKGEDGKNYKHIMEADPNSKDWKDLAAEGWDDQKLLDGTAEYKRSHAQLFNMAVQMRASQIAREMVGLNKLKEETERKRQEKEDVEKQKELIRQEKNMLVEERDRVRDDIKRHHGWLEEKRVLITKADQDIQDKDKALDEKTEALAYAKDKIKKTEFAVDNALLEVLMNHNEKGDELFKFKLWALEQDFVKSAPKEIKSKIRRVKRITEGIAILDTIIVDASTEE